MLGMACCWSLVFLLICLLNGFAQHIIVQTIRSYVQIATKLVIAQTQLNEIVCRVDYVLVVGVFERSIEVFVYQALVRLLFDDHVVQVALGPMRNAFGNFARLDAFINFQSFV